MPSKTDNLIRWFEDMSSEDVATVGGKNDSLGEMIAALKQEGIRVPDGFATTAQFEQKGVTRETLEHFGEKVGSKVTDGVRRIMKSDDR